MINLIPSEEKKKMIRGFHYRLVILALAIIGFSMLFTVITMLPSYFLSSDKDSLINEKIKIQRDESSDVSNLDTLKAVKDLNFQLNFVERRKRENFSVSDKVINGIVLRKVPSIKITQILYENNEVDGGVKDKKISISGIAPNREVLLAFRRSLEDDVLFQQVNLPISNFVKGSNIKFFMTLVPSE
jgi:hypothetical protein